MKHTKTIPLALGVLVMTLLISVIVMAWTEPSSAPPGGNVDAPLNVGGDGQIKQYVDATHKGCLGIATDGYDSGYGLTIGNSTNNLGIKTSGNSLFEGDLDVSGDTTLNKLTVTGTCTGCGGNGLWTESGSDIYYNAGNVGIGTDNPGAKLEVQGGDLKVGGATIKSDGSVVFNPQTTPPSNPVRGQVYFDANSNLIKYYDGAAWQFMDRGYLSGLIGYSGATHTRQHCADAGGMITEISGDGTNTEVCKFSNSSCPSGWARAGDWNAHTISTNPDCNTGGDPCGNNKTTCCTLDACDWSNSDPKCTYYSYSKSIGGWGDYKGGCSYSPAGGCTPGMWCACYYRPPWELYCDIVVTHTKSYSAFDGVDVTEIGCK